MVSIRIIRTVPFRGEMRAPGTTFDDATNGEVADLVRAKKAVIVEPKRTATPAEKKG